MADSTINLIKQIQLPPVGEQTAVLYNIAAKYNIDNEEIDRTYLRLDGGIMTGPLTISEKDNDPNPYLKLQAGYGTGSDIPDSIWYIQSWKGPTDDKQHLYLGGSASGSGFNPIKISDTGLLTANKISTGELNATTLIANTFSGNWLLEDEEGQGIEITHPGVAGIVALTGDLNISATSEGDGPIVTSITASGMGITVGTSTLEDLGLSTVYKYKGTVTWADLLRVNSASVGDVYSVSDMDPYGNTNADWACYTEFSTHETNGTENDTNYYGNFWQSLGGKVDLSAYAVLDCQDAGKRQYFNGEQVMTHEKHCPSMYDIASGIGCSLKNTRAVDNQAIIGEILLPTSNKNLVEGELTEFKETIQDDPNICQVTANEMGIYIITGKGTDPNLTTYGKITGKTLVGKFTANGWIGDVTGDVTGNASSSDKLRTWKADDSGTYDTSWNTRAKWINSDRLKFIIDKGTATGSYVTEVDCAYKLVDPDSTKSANECYLSVGDGSQAIYFNEGVPATIDWRIGNKDIGEHDCNNVNYNFAGYFSSNGPGTTIGGNPPGDGALWVQAHNNKWVGQIAQDYRNGSLFVRGKNNDIWQAWRIIPSAESPGTENYLVKFDGTNSICDSSIVDNEESINFTKHLIIDPVADSWREGIRINANAGEWVTIALGATGTSGTNENCWSIHRKDDNNFAICRNSSDGANGLVMTNTGMGLGTTAPEYRLDVEGTGRFTGALSANSSVSVGGTLTATGATTLSNSLAVSGATSLNSTLTVAGAVELSSSLTSASNVQAVKLSLSDSNEEKAYFEYNISDKCVDIIFN